jgi:hypothetical protein
VRNGAYDKSSAIINQRNSDGTYEARAVDDLADERNLRIEGLHWYQGELDFGFADQADVLILDGRTGTPGEIVVQHDGVYATRTDTGDSFYGSFEIYRYDLAGLNDYLRPGTYFVGMRPVQGGSQGYSRHMFAPPSGSDAYFKSADEGFPDWTPIQELYGEPKDLSFCVTGRAFGCAAYDDVLFNSGEYDDVYRLGCWRSADDDTDYIITADDFAFLPIDNYEMTGAHFYALDAGLGFNGHVDVLIYEDDSGKPGALYDGVVSAPAERVFTGDNSYGYPLYFYSVANLSLKAPLVGGWIALVPIQDTYAGASYTATAPPLGYTPYFVAPDDGYPDWTSWRNIYGGELGSAFCLSGRAVPPHDHCGDLDDVVWTSGLYDELSALTNYRDADFQTWTVDDIALGGRTTIDGLHWFQIDGENFGEKFEWTGRADFLLTEYETASDSPGQTLHSRENVAGTRIDTGDIVLGGYGVWFYSVDSLSVELRRGGRYFIGARPVAKSTGYDSWWLTAQSTGASAYYRLKSADWISWSTVFGFDVGSAFCVTGEVRCHCGDSAQDNGAVDFDDIDCFVAALIRYTDWTECTSGDQSSRRYICTNDIDGDGSVSFGDIDAFVDALLSGYCD